MLNKTYNFIHRLATTHNIWIFFITALILSMVMLVIRIPDGLAQWMGYNGTQGMFAPDSAAFAAPGTAYTKLAIYGDEGRRAYFYNSLFFDIAYPVSYALLLATGFSAILGRLLPAYSPWKKLSLLPLLAGIFDLLENLSIYTLIANYPHRLEWLDTVTAILTTAKGLLSVSGYLFLLVGWVVVLVKGRLNNARVKEQPIK